MRPLILSSTLALALLTAPSLAWAQPKLLASTPVANASVKAAKQIDLQFDEKLLAASTRVELVMTSMPGMANHGLMKMPVAVTMGKDGKSVKILPKRALTPGGYELRWTASGADKQAAKGKVVFQIK